MNKLLLLITPSDARFTVKLDFSRFAAVYVLADVFVSWTSIRLKCKELGCNCVATTRYPLFIHGLEGTREDNTGYVAYRDGIGTLLLPDLRRIYAEPHMLWLINHYLCKLSNPECFIAPPPFTYNKLTLADADRWLGMLNSPNAMLCAVDIETVREGLLITSIAFTLINKDLSSFTGVINLWDLRSVDDSLLLMRLLVRTSVPKVMHNGRYDCCYLLRLNSTPTNYLLDTYHLQHCLYPELPKDLAFCTQQYLLGIRYWKEMSGYNKLEYNARDTHATAWLFLAMLKHIKWQRADYALRNYMVEFPLVFPCIHTGMEGLAIDEQRRLELRAIEETKLQSALNRLRFVLGIPTFNPASSPQCLKLMHAMGFTGAASSDKKGMALFAEHSVLSGMLVKMIQAYRKASKAISTYYDVEQLHGRLLYSLDPAGTETGRMASKASNFWCGTQIQNIPAYSKSMFVPDEGYLFGSVDGSQAESRCTAYISEDLQLIENVETSPDFHCTNCSLFFGIPFNELFQEEYIAEDGTVVPAKVLRKDIRTVGKRVNHGANYNMGAFVLWETMGDKEVFAAAKLLDLPRYYDSLKITKHLLTCFNRTYPNIKGVWYGRVVDEVLTTGKLVGATGWTRRTFLNPRRSKPELNSLVAHPPQSLSVMVVNKTFLQAWKRQLGDWAGKLRIKAQIHDEVFFQYLKGHEHIATEIGAMYRANKVLVNGRVMVIPNEPKFGAATWGDLKE